MFNERETVGQSNLLATWFMDSEPCVAGSVASTLLEAAVTLTCVAWTGASTGAGCAGWVGCVRSSAVPQWEQNLACAGLSALPQNGQVIGSLHAGQGRRGT